MTDPQAAPRDCAACGNTGLQHLGEHIDLCPAVGCGWRENPEATARANRARHFATLNPQVAERVAEKAATAHRFGVVAMEADRLTEIVIKALKDTYPDAESDEAIVSGALTAITRFGIQRVQAEMGPQVLQVRDVFGYFAKYVQLAAEVLLNKPTGRPQA